MDALPHNTTLYQCLGAHATADGCRFAVWAPNAYSVSVIGDFNQWNETKNPLKKSSLGIWEGYVKKATKGQHYKFHVVAQNSKHFMDKTDPYAIYCEQPPGNASIIWDLDYTWNDAQWMKKRKQNNCLGSPFTIHEVHLPSWRRIPEENNRSLTYVELAAVLPKYVKELGFTHVEFLPVMEHPLYGSWGYQSVNYFAPSSRYGTPQQFMQLIDTLHQHDIGVILDWVPTHFPADAYGLAKFDGDFLYEYANEKKRLTPDWNTLTFDHSKIAVQDFLINNALFWLEKYHIDGLRVDAVSSILYLDFSRKEGEWEKNCYGGKENLEAIEFLRRLNSAVYSKFPEVQMIAEESSAWPLVSRPVYVGGLGFGMKWNMGWMHDTLYYMSLDPINRKYHQNILMFSIHYAFSENFLLPLSHDEVVYGKRSLLHKMPGDRWQQFANLRLLLGYMYGHPGKKLLFMGCEFAQWNEWDHEKSLDWHLTELPENKAMQQWMIDLNKFYRAQPALYSLDFSPEGFEWIDTHNWEESIIAFMRKGVHEKDMLLFVYNFTPVVRPGYKIGVPGNRKWHEVLNSDKIKYGGSGVENMGSIEAANEEMHGRPYSITITLPPLGVCIFAMDKTI